MTAVIEKEDIGPTPLADLLPLAMPLSLLIDPTNKCNFQCTFCPTGDSGLLDSVGRSLGFMDYDLFTKIIDDLGSMCSEEGGKLRKLDLYKDGEPLLNKKLASMIAYAKEKEVSDQVAVTTNGAALTKKRASELLESGLDFIRISIEHVNDDGYREITKTFSDYDRIRRNVEVLYNEKIRTNNDLHMHVKIVDTGLSEEEKEKFIADFSPISDTINIDCLMGWSNGYDKENDIPISSLHGMTGTNKQNEQIVCPEPFKTLAVNFDGTVSVCCVDWSHGTVVGDLRKNP